MMLTLTDKDLARMSPDLRNGLIQFMLEINHSNDYFYGHETTNNTPDYEEFLASFDENTFSEPAPINSNKKGKKVKNVIEIDENQAKDLVSNLSDKSINTLKEFTTEAPVPLSNLVGKGKPYNSYVELKRSFVGPVNRRLRTVTKNRSAVLFLKVNENDDDARISVKRGTTHALKSALEV